MVLEPLGQCPGTLPGLQGSLLPRGGIGPLLRDPRSIPVSLRGLQETRFATREESGVLGFPSRRGLTPRGMGNREETVETVSDFIFLGSKITADGDCSQEIMKRHD